MRLAYGVAAGDTRASWRFDPFYYESIIAFAKQRRTGSILQHRGPCAGGPVFFHCIIRQTWTCRPDSTKRAFQADTWTVARRRLMRADAADFCAADVQRICYSCGATGRILVRPAQLGDFPQAYKASMQKRTNCPPTADYSRRCWRTPISLLPCRPLGWGVVRLAVVLSTRGLAFGRADHRCPGGNHGHHVAGCPEIVIRGLLLILVMARPRACDDRHRVFNLCALVSFFRSQRKRWT